MQFTRTQTPSPRSNLIIMKHKTNIPRPLSIVLDKILITRRPLLLGIARQHALQTDTNTLDIVDGAPALAVKQIETDDAVGVDVRVPGDGVGVVADEYDFWSFWRGVLAIVFFVQTAGTGLTDGVVIAEHEF